MKSPLLSYVLLWSSIAAAVALAVWLRLGWIQPAATAHRCLAGLQSLGCEARHLVVLAYGRGGLRIVAVLAAVLAVAWKHPASAWLAALAGGLALVFYSPEAGAAALVIGCLRLVRLTAEALAPRGREDGRGEQHVA